MNNAFNSYNLLHEIIFALIIIYPITSIILISIISFIVLPILLKRNKAANSILSIIILTSVTVIIYHVIQQDHNLAYILTRFIPIGLPLILVLGYFILHYLAKLQIKNVIKILIIYVIVLIIIALFLYYSPCIYFRGFSDCLKGCIGDGHHIPGYIIGRWVPEKCCSGLKEIHDPELFDDECNKIPRWGGSQTLCSSNCGNGICESNKEENKCNCPEDCE